MELPADHGAVGARLGATAQHARRVAPDDLAATEGEPVVLPVDLVSVCTVLEIIPPTIGAAPVTIWTWMRRWLG
ncbi:MAG: hypothetical protein Q8R49_00810 [Rhodoferax sp.]|nr:hypothetical protein [Rhodoferax sp.]